MWLIVFGSGPESEDLADRIAEQCRSHRITARKRAIDDYDPAELARFPSLVVCLPSLSSSTKVRRTLEPFAMLVADYRARWYRGLDKVGDGDLEVLDVGVVQLFGETVALHNPTMRSAYKTACYVQATDAEPSIDALRPYRSFVDAGARAAPWDDAVDVADDVIATALQSIRLWGVQDIAKFSELLTCIENCRNYFEDPARPALYRPSSQWNRNRLDFILDGPDLEHTTKAAAKTWGENGARVFRHVRDQLTRIVPGIARPGDPRAPHAQRDLRRLYESLKLVDVHLRGA